MSFRVAVYCVQSRGARVVISKLIFVEPNMACVYCINILASSFNVQKQDFILGDVKGRNEDNLICIQIKYYIYTMRCLSKRLSVEGAIASIKSLAKTCQQIALEKGQIHIFNNRWRNWILII